MKVFAAVVLALALGIAPASAQKINLSTITCKDFINSGQETIGLIMMWLDGYYADEDDPAVVDFDQMKANGEKLGAYCAKNPTIGLMTAAEPILRK